MTVVERRIGFRYMTRFACIGPACEDPCCAGWSVPVDEAHHRLIELRLGATPEGRAELARALRPPPAAVEPSPARFADMAMSPDGRCAMFEPGGLCALQRRFGEDLLPDTCAIYPRSIGRIGDRAELAGTLSCPEVARLCLLADDAMDLVEVEPERLTRGLFNKQLSPEGAEPYDERFEQVRGFLFELIARRYPLASRLLFVAVFAHRTAGYYKRGYKLEAAHFEAAMAQLGQPEVRERLHAQLAAADPRDPFALTVVLQVMLVKRTARPTRFGALVDRVLGGYPCLQPGGEIDLGALWAAYRARREALPAAVHARLERYLEHYVKNQLVREWFIGWPTLLGYVQSLLVSIAVLRFLLIGHPDTARAAMAADPARLAAILDPVAVEVFQAFARAVQHDGQLTYRIVESLEAQQMQTLAHSVNLLTA
jgi:lysine-N-methylase